MYSRKACVLTHSTLRCVHSVLPDSMQVYFLLRERRWAISGYFLCSNRKCPRKTNQTDEKYSSTARSRMNGEIHYYCSVKLLSEWCKTPVISVLEPLTGTEGCPEHSGGERLILCAVAFRILPLVYLK